MVTFRLFGINVSVSYFFLSILAVLILIDRSGMLSISLLAVVFHELGHLCMMRFLKVTVSIIEFSLSTVRVTTIGMMDYKKSLIVAVSGPFANLCLSFCVLSNWELAAYFGVANLVMFAFNMLPAKGLDGGDVLYYALLSLGFKNAVKIFAIISTLSIVAIIMLGVGLFVATRSNITLLLVGIYLLILSFKKI